MKLCQDVAWNGVYSIGDEGIDAEHKKIFDLANKVKLCNCEEKIKKAVKEVISYTKFHFTSEERYMQEIKYDLYIHHKELHQKIIQQMHQFIKSIASMDTPTFERRLIEYMDIWLVNHIVRDDKRIASFMLKKKYIS